MWRALRLAGLGSAIAIGALALFRFFIIGGDDAPNEHWVVMVNGDEACTGAIVGSHAVLTAAHCFDKTITTTASIVVDGISGQLAATCTQHRDYHHMLPQFDVAICTFVDNIGLTPRPVIHSAATVVDRPVTFFGFGCFSTTPPLLGGKRRKGTGTGRLTGSVLNVVGNGSCWGDSGGPVLLDKDAGPLLGVISDHGFLFRPIAWAVNDKTTANWFDDFFPNKICFEGNTGGPCDRARR